jgi:tetratricopeptide (TPR) repeat protein
MLRAKADSALLRERVAAANTPEALSILVSTREALKSETPGYMSAFMPELINQQDQFLFRAEGTQVEADYRLELSRLHLMAGRRAQWLRSFDAYVQTVGAEAGQVAATQNVSDLDKRRQVYRAKATAYLEEAKRLHLEGDHTASLRLTDWLFTLYPSSMRAYEGQMVAARCYLANQQPEEAIEAYRRIAYKAPNAEFAQEAGKTLLKMTALMRDVDLVASEARTLRERFAGEAFERFSFMEEAKALQAGGETYYPRAIAAFRNIQNRWPDSPEAELAVESIREMRTSVIPLDLLKLDSF